MTDSDSIVGSSENAPERSGLAPIKSPAATNTVLRICARSPLTSVAMCSAPPAETGRIGDRDAAGRRHEVTVEVVDGKDGHLDRCAGVLGWRRRAQPAARQHGECQYG